MKRYLLDTSIVAFFIGCTAVTNGLVMVTDNVKHFSRIEGIQIENWVDRSL